MSEPALASATVPAPRLRFDRMEVAGAFGDLGTLVPFVVAYVSLAGIDAGAVLFTLGAWLVIAGLHYGTPFPVQPMKAIGAAATTQAVHGVTVSAGAVYAAGLATGAIWLILGASGLARRLVRWVPRTVTLGLILGLGFSFMGDGIRFMSEGWGLAAVALAAALLLLGSRAAPAMLVLLAGGVGWALLSDPELAARLAAIRPALRLPEPALGAIAPGDWWVGAVILALPQLPLTLGNAVIAISEENNRLFPDRPVTERRVALSTGLMNLTAGALGGVPICHGAGGMAGQVRFGARSGASPVLMGVLLLALGLCFADSVGLLFSTLPRPLLGVLLFLTGVQLALGTCGRQESKEQRFVLYATAAFAMWNIGVAFIFGLLAQAAASRGWVRL